MNPPARYSDLSRISRNAFCNFAMDRRHYFHHVRYMASRIVDADNAIEFRQTLNRGNVDRTVDRDLLEKSMYQIRRRFAIKWRDNGNCPIAVAGRSLTSQNSLVNVSIGTPWDRPKNNLRGGGVANSPDPPVFSHNRLVFLATRLVGKQAPRRNQEVIFRSILRQMANLRNAIIPTR
jgi:hypothetical protein